MPKTKDYIFVLWDQGFDERVATIFVTTLRDAGLLVKVVGLTVHQIRGARGLALTPDLPLDQALSLMPQVICLIIPTNFRGHKRFEIDPRIDALFERVQAQGIKVVMGQGGDGGQTRSWLPPAVQANAIVYPEIENLIEFVQGMTAWL